MPGHGLLSAALVVCGIAFALRELLLSTISSRPHVTIRGWAAGFGAAVLANRWSHSHDAPDGRLLHYAAIGGGIALTLLWLNEPSRVARAGRGRSSGRSTVSSSRRSSC